MRKFIIFLIIIVCLSAILFADQDIMPLSLLRPGMHGYGLSVFEGVKIEKFPITVLGITRRFNGGIDAILIKIDGGYCVENKTGVIAGMSGSPIYVGNKLIGAVAYGVILNKTTICGVQPIEEMLRAFDEHADKTEANSSKTPDKVTIDGKTYNGVIISNNADKDKNIYSQDNLILTPLTTLVTSNGLSKKSIDFLNKEFGDKLTFKEAGGGYYYEDAKYNLTPGAAVGPILMRGDISLTSSGTLTYIKGKKYLAFGHDMFNMGSLNVPLGVYYIQTVIPAYDMSFKISSLIKDIGSLNNDTITAISGNFDAKASMIPMSINIKDGQKHKVFNVDVANLENPLVWGLMNVAIGEAADALLASEGAGAVNASFKFQLKDGTNISYHDLYYSDISPISAVQLDFFTFAKIIAFNKFKKVDIEKVNVDINYVRKKTTAIIEKIYLTENKVISGGKTKLHIVLNPYNGNTFEKVVDLNIPYNLAEGKKIIIGVSSGESYFVMERKLELAKKKITNFNQLVDAVEGHERNNEIIIKVAYSQEEVNISGKTYPFLPEYFKDILTNSPQSSIETETGADTYRIPVSYYVSNFQAISASVADGEIISTKDADKYKDEEEKKDEKTSANKSCEKIKKINTKISEPKKDNNSKQTNNNNEAIKTENNVNDKPAKPEETAAQKSKEESKKKEEPILPFTSATASDIEAKDFFEGKIDGSSISDASFICLAPLKKMLYASDSNFIYSCSYNEKLKSLIAADDEGNIINASTQKIIANIGEGIISSILSLPDGSILAGQAPSGKIFKINEAGNVTLFCALPVKYIWKLKFHSGYIWASTGVPAKVYKISLNGKAEEYASINDTHIHDIDFKDNEMVLGTNHGSVYLVDSYKKITSVYQKQDSNVTGVAFDNLGNIYASLDYMIVKITPNHTSYVYSIPGKDKYITALSVNKDNDVIFATSGNGKIYKLLKNEQILFLHDLKCNEIFDISKDSNGNFYFAAGDKASVYVVSEDYASSGTYISRVFNLKDNSAFGALTYAKETHPGADISIHARSGQTNNPDSSWDIWRKVDLNEREAKVKSKPGKYFQYKVELRTNNKKITPKFLGLFVKYKSIYKLPFIDFVFPYTFDALSGKQDIEWVCGDTNLDLVRFDLYCSKFDENKWEKVAQDLPVSLKKKEIKEGKNPISTNQIYTWDTGKKEDGKYRLKLTAYNILEKKLGSKIISKPFVISNSKPVIKIISKNIADDFLTIEGSVLCKYNFPKHVRFSFNEEIWYIANPKDGMYRSFDDGFIIKVQISKENKDKKLIIEAEDEAGNKSEMLTKI